jgi:peptide/nickel transport system substrate-binding protein
MGTQASGDADPSVRRRRMLRLLGSAGAAGIAGCIGGDGGGSGGGTGGSGGGGDGGSDGESREYGIELKSELANPDNSDLSVDDVSMGGELVGTLGADVAQYDPPQQTDTTSVKATLHIYEPLIRPDWVGTYHGVLAEEFEQLDETTYRFSLREGVHFHNGDEVTAEDVRFSLERYEGAPNEADVYTWYDGTEIVDDYTVELSTDGPYAPFQTDLSAVSIVPSAAGEDGDVNLDEEPVGTGPYRFVEHRTDDSWRMERNEDYWFEGNDTVPGVAPVETVTLRIIAESAAQVAAIEAGDVDMVNSPRPGSISDLRDNADVEVATALGAETDQLFYPLGVEPFDDRRFRRGITRLIPRRSIVETVYDGTSIPAYGSISPMLGDASPVGLHEEIAEEWAGYDPERATALIEEVFEEEGVEPPFETTIVTNDDPQRVQWCQLVQESMQRTELFDVSIDRFEWNAYLDRVNAPDSHETNEIIALGWSGGWDPDNHLYDIFHSDRGPPACCNTNSYSSETADELLDRGLRQTDREERIETYRELQRHLGEDAPAAFVQFSYVYDAVRADRVRNWHAYPNDGYEILSLYAPYVGQVAWVEDR